MRRSRLPARRSPWCRSRLPTARESWQIQRMSHLGHRGGSIHTKILRVHKTPNKGAALSLSRHHSNAIQTPIPPPPSVSSFFPSHIFLPCPHSFAIISFEASKQMHMHMRTSKLPDALARMDYSLTRSYGCTTLRRARCSLFSEAEEPFGILPEDVSSSVAAREFKCQVGPAPGAHR